MKEPVSRGYYGGIFFEFALQERSADAIIVLPSFPSGNDFNDLIKFFFEKGYHVFVPRYRGSFQSSGKFLSKNPVEDMMMFLKHLDKGEAKSLWDNQKKKFQIKKKILVSGSFGGAIALGLAAKSKTFSHIILQAPIWDFATHNSENDERDFKQTTGFVKRAYKNCYRYEFDNVLIKLEKFKEIKPNYYLPVVNELGIPILVLHDPNDKFVSFKRTKYVAEKLPKITLIEHYLGHKINDSILSAYWKDIDKFIKINYLDTQKKD